MTLAQRLFPKQTARLQAETRTEVINQAREILNREVGAARQAVYNVQQAQASAIPGPFQSWSRSNGGKWPGGMDTSFGGLIFNNWQVRQQARDIYEDSVQARAMVERFADTVVDSGLMLDPEPQAEALGITPEAAEEWGHQVATAFHLWASQKRQHRAGQYTFYQAQRLLQIYAERDNDTFMRLYYERRPDLLNPLQFEIIDPNQIRGDALTSTLLMGTYADGIDRNPDGTEKLYKIWVQAPDTMAYSSVDVPRVGPSGKLQMLHGFVPTYAGQGRGLSGLGIALQEFEALTTFTQAQVMKAINQSNIVFTTENMQAPPSDPFESIGQIGAGPSNFQAGAPGASGQSGMMIQSGMARYTAIEEATLTAPGSTGVFGMDTGDKLIPVQSTAPSVGYAEFVDAFCSYLCAARGMPLEVLLMKFNQNYSASRAALLLFWRVACMKRDHLADDFLNPIYEAWLGGEIAAGRIRCPGWSDPRLRAAWLSCRWNGTPMPNIDPNATAKADQLYIEMGAQTLDDVARNLNGSSGKMNRAKLKAEFKEMTAAGTVPWSTTGLGSAMTPGQGANGQPIEPPPTKKPPQKTGATA